MNSAYAKESSMQCSAARAAGASRGCGCELERSIASSMRHFNRHLLTRLQEQRPNKLQ